jgi:hypothetical protein
MKNDMIEVLDDRTSELNVTFFHFDLGSMLPW